MKEERFFWTENVRQSCSLMRLFCFHHAGGGASVFREWGGLLSANVEVVPVRLPGRENRIMETPCKRMGPLVDKLVDEIQKYLDRPYAFFGHSMGAAISFELAKRIRERNLMEPFHLFVSGRCAPNWLSEEPVVHNLPDDKFIERLKDIGGTPEEVFESSELLQLVLPILRADFEIIETLKFESCTPLACSISAFGGSGDYRVPLEGIEAWGEFTTSSFGYKIFSGDHFFIKSSRDALLAAVNTKLYNILSGPRVCS